MVSTDMPFSRIAGKMRIALMAQTTVWFKEFFASEDEVVLASVKCFPNNVMQASANFPTTVLLFIMEYGLLYSQAFASESHELHCNTDQESWHV